jgi:hypothetical protein
MPIIVSGRASQRKCLVAEFQNTKSAALPAGKTFNISDRPAAPVDKNEKLVKAAQRDNHDLRQRGAS